jgi:hypothetical protein
MIARPTGLGGIYALKAQFPQIERLDEGINHTNRIACVDPVIEAFRQQRRLPPIRPRNELRRPAFGDMNDFDRKQRRELSIQVWR